VAADLAEQLSMAKTVLAGTEIAQSAIKSEVLIMRGIDGSLKQMSFCRAELVMSYTLNLGAREAKNCAIKQCALPANGSKPR
jgi:hypothetical protein